MSKHMSAEHTKPSPRAVAAAAPAAQAAPGPGPGLGPPPAKRPAKPLPNLIPIGAPLGQVRGATPSPAPAARPGPASTPSPPAANGDDAHSAETAKKKNSFFDQLRLYPGTGAGSELVCVHCGHEAKCLSELTRHNKLHQGTSRALGTSTRCQHCRHRCKTSADLAQHVRTCAKAMAAAAAERSPGSDLETAETSAPAPAAAVHAAAPAAPEAEETGGNLTCADMESDIAAATEANNAAVLVAHPVNIPSFLNDEDDDPEPLYHGQPMPDADIPKADVALVGVETAPGYGSVLERTEFEARAAKENVPTPPVAPKKVFKCPHCSFWAATASRFHVHVVGHANKKPFACSICMYRSNWRWDITKHIKRIKDAKDAKDHSHDDAKILMTDDSGRRNYAKYYRHYLWLNVAEQLLDGLQSLINTYQKQYGSPVNPASVEAGHALPAPPKLTRAPAPRTVPVPTSSPGALLRPPPPLQAAAQHPSTQVIILPGGVRLGQQPTEQQGQTTTQQPPPQSLKRPADTPVPNVGSDPKKSNPEIKKTVWRCKQCHFRDGDRAVVLAHVKGHYRQQQEAFALAKLKNSQAGASQETNNDTPKRIDPEQTVIRKVPYQCDVCPYVSLNEATFQAHVNCHKERNDVLFKCFYCPFYVSTKEEVIQHMTVHQTSAKPENSAGVPAKTTTPQPSSNKETSGIKIQIKKEAGLPDQDPSYSCSEVQSPNQPPRPPPLDFTNMTEAPVCWVFRDEKLQKMLRCRFCPHVNLRKANMLEHEKMHLKRPSLGSDGLESTGQYTQYHCPDCTYVCNNAGVLSTHTRVHSSSYPLSYTFYDPYRNEILQMKEIMEKYSLKPKIEETPPKSSPPKEAVDTVNENKLCGINVMSLLDPNQSLTDAVLAMKKKFNLELDGEPFAEPVEDSAESPPCSPLKPLNDGSDPIATDTVEEKQLHFCNLCPARFLFRKELGIHSRFHNLYLIHKCDHCTYTARQRPHLQAHFKVHTADYQDRTTALMNMYKVNKEFPMPRIVCDTTSGNLWIVATTPEYEEPVAPSPQFTCQKCPAAFFKTEAYQAHLALHGSNNPHKCRICDYAVKSYGDLVKHMMSHGCRRTVAKKILQGQMEVPASLGGDSRNSQSTSRFEQPMTVNKEETPASEDNGTGNAGITCPSIKVDMDEREDLPVEADNLEGASSLEKSENDLKDKENSPSKSPSSSADTSGSPEFIYPTLCRNGRVKVKKYKCKKCPSAFEKHDQFLVHMNLHGSKQRYKCPHCDYSVKFLANHIQHLRRHKINDEAKESPKTDIESSSNEEKEIVPEDSENIPTPPPSSPTRSAKSTGGKGEKLSVADKQAIMVLQQRRAKRAAVSRESLDKNYWCSHCPYSSPRRDQVESHMRRHVCVSGIRSVYLCDHCDYSVPNKHFLRDHCKLHFDVSKAPRPDAYMICNALELFTSSGFSGKNKSKGKVMIFQDKGSNVTSDRFLPPLPPELNDDSSDGSNRIYINPKTFESESFSENGSKDNSDTAESDNYTGNDLDNKLKDKSYDRCGKEGDLSEPLSATLSFPEATSHNSGSVLETYIPSKPS
ncbi:Zinc finger protein 252 [Frankliniella fusca]|uniref:Zinc finger protein 252 n=1 Tax=Frankliniella fusca TaxID=407009 RepID=A0AAE1GSW0_9NEOP|nr:Zinc finger protein 252 [Frankliniella fusca]